MNFRKYLQMRDWGWFVIIQKTRGLIGLPNPEEELRQLEEAANNTYGEYKAALDKTAELEASLDGLRDEIGAMSNLISESIKGSLKLSSLVKSSLVLTIGVVGGLLKLSKLLLGVGKTNESSGLLDDNKPSPVSHLEVLSEVPLGNLDELSLVSLHGINSAADSLQDLSLDESNPFDDQVITSLLKLGKSTSSEEDKGVSKPISLSVKSNLVHESIGGGLVVRG